MKQFLFFSMHRFFSSFALQLFFSFGVLLILEKTDSVVVTLFFFLIHYMSIITFNTIFLLVFKRVVNFLGDRNTMAVGLGATAISYGALFFLPDNASRIFLYIFAISIIGGIGANFYYILSNSLELGIIGEAKKPGLYATLFSSVNIISGIMAALLVFIFSINKHSLWSFIFCGGSLILSVVFLYFFPIKQKIHSISFKSYIRRLSWREHLASAELTHEIRNTMLPLVILFTIGSSSKSIGIISITAIATLVFIAIVGRLKDKENNIPIYIASSISIISFIAYFSIESPPAFIVLGIIGGSSYAAINVAFNAKLGRKLANSGNRLETSLANDFSKLLGRIAVVLICLGIYTFLETIPGTMLVFGAIFLLPRIIYILNPIEGFSPEKQ